jgi:hypothetical protein
MTANTAPIFPLTPKIGIGTISVANTNRDGTGTLVDILTGATDGTRVSRITIKASGTTTAGVVMLFIYNGSITRLWREIAVTAATPSTTVTAFEYTLTLSGEDAIILPSTYVLRAAPQKAETFNVIAEGGDY